MLVSGIPAWGTREWGALSQTPVTWCGVLVPFQSRNMTCSGPRVCLSICTHTCTHIFHFWQEGKPKVIEINRQKWKPVLLIFFNVIPCRLAHIFLKNSYTFFSPLHFKDLFHLWQYRKEVEFGLWGLFLVQNIRDIME